MPDGVPTRSLTRLTLRLVPLSPVHVGDGTELRPDEYLLEETKNQRCYDEYGEEIAEAGGERPQACLARFDPAEAMRLMSAAERHRFQSALDRASLADAARALRYAGARCITERIPVSGRSLADLRRAIEDPGARSGQVKPFVRTGGRPYIPGSSVKGAFRTALASAALPRDTRAPDKWTHEDAMEAALGISPADTSTDPLRFLHVSDAVLPEGATLIDRAEVFHPRNPDTRGMQLHYERTKSLMDGGDAPEFQITLTVDSRARDPSLVTGEKARFDARSLLAQLFPFHFKIFREENKRFFPDTGKVLEQKIRAQRSPSGKPVIADGKWDPDFFLFRLGRFGHFESKSLEEVRRGHVPQAKDQKIRPPGAWGVTRTVTRDAKGNPIPFGWVLGWVTGRETP
jgi:CRISPR-associated protein Csm5